MTKTKHTYEYDVVIVGGGLAGLTLAVLLGRAGVTVGIIERHPLTTQTTKIYDARTTAISAGSVKILTRAGIWNDLEKNACPIHKIEILDGPHLHGTWPVLLNFDTGAMSSPPCPPLKGGDIKGGNKGGDVKGEDGPFGYIVDNIDLRAAQAHAIQNTPNIHMIAPATLVDMTVTEASATLTLDTGEIIRTGLVVGADGRGSVVRDMAGIPTRGWPYPHTAVVSTITHTGPHDHIAIEHFLSSGPFAVLPFTNDQNGLPRSAVVWSEHKTTARKIMGMSDRTFIKSLMSRLPDRYGNVVHVGPRGSYPLSLQHAARYTAPRVALVSDAAHGMHPIAGQGLNLGLRDVHVLADLCIAASSLQNTASSPRRRGSGMDFGAPDILDAYARARKPDIFALMSGTDILTKLFGSRLPGIRPLRKIGMRIIDHLPPVKNFFIRVAKGC